MRVFVCTGVMKDFIAGFSAHFSMQKMFFPVGLCVQIKMQIMERLSTVNRPHCLCLALALRATHKYYGDANLYGLIFLGGGEGLGEAKVIHLNGHLGKPHLNA